MVKGLIYHYTILAHQFDDDDASGISRGTPSMEFLVTLGYYDGNTGQHNATTPMHQESTLMHELGHNLNLTHGGAGGDQRANCKPNYLSIMSYSRQWSSPIADRPLSYSKSVLEPLDETNLDELKGIEKSKPAGLRTVYGDEGEQIVALTGGPIDWNRNGKPVDSGLSKDVNRILVQGCNPDPPRASETLYGYNDWQNLLYNKFLAEIISDVGVENLTTTIYDSLSNSTGATTNQSNNFSLGRFDKGIKYDPSLDREMTLEDIKDLNTGLILSLSNNIQEQLSDSNNTMSSLSDESEASDVEALKKFYEDKLLGTTSESVESALSDEPAAINNTSILGNVRSDNLEEAIEGLRSLQPAVDSPAGGLSDEAQADIEPEIDNAIAALESQSCAYQDCSVVQKSANSTIEYG